MQNRIKRNTLLSALVLPCFFSMAVGCKSRTLNPWFGKDSTKNSEKENIPGPRHSSPDSCGKLKPGSPIALSMAFEIRVRDPYSPLSLVQLERRYVVSPEEKKIQAEETPAGIDCCEKRGDDKLSVRSFSDEKWAELNAALASLTLSNDLRCATESEIKTQIENNTCGAQAGYSVLLDSGRVFADTASCLPTRDGLWGQANGLENVIAILEKN